MPPNWNMEAITAGSLQVRLAESQEEVAWSQELRYRVFVEEMGAEVSPTTHKSRRDEDEFDAVCDHLLVLDHNRAGNPVVGTYRLLRSPIAKKFGRFYTESEFDVTNLKKLPSDILELGRSCVDEHYRTRAAMQLLWRGIGAYVTQYDLKYMFGCASLHGVNPQEHAESLSYLYHNHLAPKEVRTYAISENRTEMNLMPPEAIDAKRAILALPPLIKGYLRLGCHIGDSAFIDRAFKSIDVCIILKTEAVTGKYYDRYAAGEKP